MRSMADRSGRRTALRGLLDFLHERWSFAESGEKEARRELLILNVVVLNVGLLLFAAAVAGALFVVSVLYFDMITGAPAWPVFGGLAGLTGLAGAAVVRRVRRGSGGAEGEDQVEH
jgi:hypothetical protein